MLLIGIAYPIYSDIFAVSFGEVVKRKEVEVRGRGVASDGAPVDRGRGRASSSTDQTLGLESCLRHGNGLSIADLT
jgi:hypothetical protein